MTVLNKMEKNYYGKSVKNNLQSVWEGINVCGCFGRQMEGNDSIEQNGKNLLGKKCKKRSVEARVLTLTRA